PPRKRNRILHLLGEMWPAYLIEVVVIILGISITLVLEEWRDSGKEEKLERVYMQNLLGDVNADLESLKYALTSTEAILGRGDELLRFAKDPVRFPLTSHQVNADVRAILGRPKFIGHDATFSDLKSSGNLHLVNDISLKNLLFGYYSQAQGIKENQDAEQQATITLSGAYFLRYFALDDPGGAPAQTDTIGVRALAKNLEFRNNVLLRVTNRKELQALYQAANALALQLQAALLKKTS
ncbi:MAG TPA: hypothetical protein VKQ52_08785, partial [Puia sp.]|nr:hypothetical protein [Puia sp.]